MARKRPITKKCTVCGAPDGTWGDSQVGIPMCYDCYHKIYRHDMTLERTLDAARIVGISIVYGGENFTASGGRFGELDRLLTEEGCVGQARRDLITRIQGELQAIVLCQYHRKMPGQYRPELPCPRRIIIDNCLVAVE